jgi:hypothetical protein
MLTPYGPSLRDLPVYGELLFRQAVNDYRLMQKLIEQVSELEWKRLQEKKR